MLSLEKLLRRFRASETEVECFHYDGRVTPLPQKSAQIQHFLFNDPWFQNSASIVQQQTTHGSNLAIQPNAAFQQQSGPSITDVAKELERNTTYYKATEAVGGLPLHDSIKYIKFRDVRFPLYYCGGAVPADPKSLDEFEDMSLQIAATIKALHDAGFVVWDLHPKNVLQMTIVTTNSRAEMVNCGGGIAKIETETTSWEKIYMISPAALNSIKTQSWKQLTSLIAGCSIISPYQIITDILCSKHEVHDNELHEFKTKMTRFWIAILKQEYKHVFEVCKFYQSRHQGSIDYLDAVILKLCKTRQDRGKTYVVKDPKSLLQPALFRCLDWFALGILMDELLEKLLETAKSAQPPDHITKAIHDCLLMNEPHEYMSTCTLTTVGSE